MLGLCGAHRTGKTTLAQSFAQRLEIPFVRTSGTEVFQLLGKDPKAEYPIDERLAIQEAILYAFERQYAAARERASVFIADRTPIDLASYMLADVQRATLGEQPGTARLVGDYVRRCIESANYWFATIVLVQPGIALVEESGKAPACPAFIEHLNALQTGLLLDERLHARHYLIPRRFVTLEQRIESVKNAVLHANDMALKGQREREASGVRLH